MDENGLKNLGKTCAIVNSVSTIDYVLKGWLME